MRKETLFDFEELVILYKVLDSAAIKQTQEIEKIKLKVATVIKEEKERLDVVMEQLK